MEITLQPIGIVKSSAKEAVDENWDQVKSEIHLNHEFSQGLAGM